MKYQPHIDAVIGMARAEGCRVVLAKNVADKAAGYFYPSMRKPTIFLATDCKYQRTIFYALAHEFMHFRQYKSGVPDAVKNLKSYSLNRILLCEYECEKMTVAFIDQYELPNFNESARQSYISGANRYMQFLKYNNATKRSVEYPGNVKSVKVPSDWWTNEELIEPLSEIDKRAFDIYLKKLK